MSTVVIGGGGPRPNATVVSISPVDANGVLLPPVGFEIRDAGEVLATSVKASHLHALLPLIQSGE